MTTSGGGIEALSVEAIQSRVQSVVLPRFLPAAARDRVGPDDDLLTLLDSIDLLKLATRLESTFEIRIANDELTAENMGSLARMAVFLGKKVNASRMPT